MAVCLAVSVTVWLGLLGARVVGGFGFCGAFAGGLVIVVLTI